MDTARLFRHLALALGLLLAAAAHAGELRSGDFTIRYNALTTQALPATAASAYGLSRSANQGLLIIAVERGDGTNVTAEVRGRATTLLGQAVPLTFHDIVENGVTSMLGRFAIPGNGSLRFDLDVTPAGGTTTQLHFVQDFVVD